MSKPKSKQPFIGIWFHDNRLSIDKQNRMKIYLNQIFYHYRVFVDISEFSDYIDKKPVAKIIIIISDLELYLPLIKLTQRHEEIFQQVYVFLTAQVPITTCFMTINMETLYAELLKNVLGIRNDTRSNQFTEEFNPEILRHVNQISPSLSVFDKKIEQNTPIRHLSKESLKFLCFLTMKNILLRMSHDSKGRIDMWTFCKRIYGKNDAQWKYIDELRRTYDACKAIEYYTGNSCLSRTVNQVCRTENIEHIFKFRVYITDLHNQLDKYSSQTEQNDNKPSITNVYRGKVLSESILQQIIDNKDGLISMNGFLSTTMDPKVADIYAGDDHINEGCRRARFQLHINKIKQPYAYIANGSLKKDEREVLFSVGTIWSIESVEYDKDSCTIKLTSSDELDSQLIELFQKYTGEGCTLLSLGDILFELGEYDQAEWVYQKMLDENCHSNKIYRDLYYRIGIIRFNRKDYSIALEKFKKVEHLFQLSNDRTNEIGSTQPIDTNKNRTPFIVVYNYMGIICEKQDKVEEAIKYYKKALEEKASSLDLATVHNNLGRLYSILDSYNEAQIHLTKAIEVIGYNEPQRIKFQEDLDRNNKHLEYLTLQK